MFARAVRGEARDGGTCPRGAVVTGNAAADMFQESLEDFLRRLIDRCAHRIRDSESEGEGGRQGEKEGRRAGEMQARRVCIRERGSVFVMCLLVLGVQAVLTV